MYGRNSLFSSAAQLMKAVRRAGLGQRPAFSGDGKIGECLSGVGDAHGDDLRQLALGEARGLLGSLATPGVASPRRCGVPRTEDCGLKHGWRGGLRSLSSRLRGRVPKPWPREGGSELGRSAACNTARAPMPVAPPSLAGRVVGGFKLAINSCKLSSSSVGRRPACLPVGGRLPFCPMVLPSTARGDGSDVYLCSGDIGIGRCGLPLRPRRPVGESSSPGRATCRPVAPRAPTAGFRLREGSALELGVRAVTPL
mmetsp:Transcript_45352/g.105883  ORF Transcript_45352/g.105883 Transcript_45352/m.105883 type:complete len:254 (+) Transcript_45352:825-1586(+)